MAYTTEPETGRPRSILLRVIAGVGAVLALGVAVGAECRLFETTVPAPASLKLNDGEHVIAKTETPHGRFEVRIRVKGNEIAPHEYYFAGKRMRETQLAKVPPEVRECFRGLQRSDSGVVPSLALAAKALEWLQPTLHAFDRRIKCTVQTSCSQTTCCSLATCGTAQSVYCTAI